MKRYREGIAGRRLLPEAGAEGHAVVDPDAPVRDASARGRRAARRLPARELDGGAPLDGADALHRHERVVLARRQARTGPTTSSSTSTRPTSPTAFAQAIEVAHLVHDALDELELRRLREDERRGRHPRARADRSGARRSRRHTSSQRRRPACSRQRHPGLVTTEWLKKKRQRRPRRPPPERRGEDDRLGVLGPPEAGRTGLDAARAGRSSRPACGPRDFTMAAALERVAELGDLFEPVLEDKRPLGAAAKSLARLTG